MPKTLKKSQGSEPVSIQQNEHTETVFRQLWNNEWAKRQMTETKHFKQGIIVLIEVNVRFLSLFIVVILPWIYHNFHETIILVVTLVVAFA